MFNHDADKNTPKNLRILVAEDYEVNQKIAQLILEKAGYQVDIVADGQQVLEACKQKSYDLILMDIQMPVMDGHVATREIRAWELKAQGSKLRADDRGQKTENRFQNTEKKGQRIEAQSEIRNLQSEIKRIPIIAMTGDASEGGFDPQRYPGMNDCVCKPLQRAHLLSVINRWTDPASSCTQDQRLMTEIDPPVKKQGETNLPLDLDRAVDEFMGNKKILYAVLAEFIDQVGDQITVLREAGCRRDYRAIASEGHRIKGGAANLAARGLSLAASDLEKAAESQKAEEICKLIERLEEEFSHLERFLRQKGLYSNLGKT
ncbi:MAG: response regulator [Desulfobacterales bacterium]|nr:MAG: response regulator [Desulfobacterales bacterium]